MAPLRPALFLTAAAGAMAASDTLGPAAFMWPPDRLWSEQTDNTPPCGSAASVTNRTLFPLCEQAIPTPHLAYSLTQLEAGGKVALMAQDDSYHVQLSISFSSSKPSADMLSLPHLTLPGPRLTPSLFPDSD